MRLTVSLELIEAARSSCSKGAVERVLEVFWPHAFRIARSIVQDDALAEDAAQEACAVMYREIGRLRSVDAFRVWAYRIVAREALRVVKRCTTEAGYVGETRSPDIDARVDVMRALAQLPAGLRAVVVLHYYAEMSSGEIGAALGMPSATVRFRLARARAKLKEMLGYDRSVTTFVEVSE